MHWCRSHLFQPQVALICCYGAVEKKDLSTIVTDRNTQEFRPVSNIPDLWITLFPFHTGAILHTAGVHCSVLCRVLSAGCSGVSRDSSAKRSSDTGFGKPGLFGWTKLFWSPLTANSAIFKTVYSLYIWNQLDQNNVLCTPTNSNLGGWECCITES